ncbi:unnamed protein product [Thelazia callipaeda]|uniref:Helicase ATP-binding domain-containing protein n=1 Tax=Thelazia callipaeda TaxID=103827 RepID=A0A0N5D9P7_THECL|nr:unnamed protein product [Thelazia callipaeda]
MSSWDTLDDLVIKNDDPKVTNAFKEQEICLAKDSDNADRKDDRSIILLSKNDTVSQVQEEENGSIVVAADFTEDNVELTEVLNRFKTEYENIISEFADVEIFLISLDGLLIELTAHTYLNWTLGGQTIVIAKQIEIILKQLTDIGGKFKLIWFTNLAVMYAKDTVLNFLHSFVAAYLLQSKWASFVVNISSPADSVWSNYIRELTPSFIIIGVADVSEKVVAEDGLGFKKMLASIAIQTLALTTPVVYLNETNRNIDLSSCKNISHLWAQVIGNCKKNSKLQKDCDLLSSAVLISSLICEYRGMERRYLVESPASNKSKDFIKFQRTLLSSCSALLDSLDLEHHSLCFSLIDLWDGLLINGIYNAIKSGVKIPSCIQKKLASLHQTACLELSLEVDTEDALFGPVVKKELDFKCFPLLPIDCALLRKYAPEIQSKIQDYYTETEPLTFANFSSCSHWRFDIIEESYGMSEPPTDEIHKYVNRSRQKLSAWYELFAESLEGRGTGLLVDFTRTPRSFAARNDQNDKKKNKEKQQWQQKSKGGSNVKNGGKSKKEMILEANKNKKHEKLVEDEKRMIRFALQQGKNATFILERLVDKVELDSSKAICAYEQVLRLVDNISELEGRDFLEKRRVQAVPIMHKLKNLFTVYWRHLNDKQKEYITDLWESLGFEKKKKQTAFSEGKLTLNMNMVYYQLAYAGEVIDIQSDPQKDDRVTGFLPDAWQRAMLDVIDRNNSVIVIAPTSAGKTFVSYYCIERILRQSDDDMVVYVSPSKALLNQVCGSVYARFHNKTLSGGKSLFGFRTMEYEENPWNCQVLITLPECLEILLLSTNPQLQAVVAKIKYVIFDEVHCISASSNAQIWEHLLLLIRCPFLALSATISNATVFHRWLQSVEKSKTVEGSRLRKVELITYGERYSELELSMLRISSADNAGKEDGSSVNSMIEHFMPYGVYKPTKLSMFGIPDDQQLTARQILDLYYALAEVDQVVKDEFEPCKFFNYKSEGEKVWLTRKDIRRLEHALKSRFLEWLKENPKKVEHVLQKIRTNVACELDYRSTPFDQQATAMKSISPLILELRDKNLLPAICFNENRRICEKLAVQLCSHLETLQINFEMSPEYKKYEIKDEDKFIKMAKRKRDVATKEKKKSKAKDKFERAEEEEQENNDQDADDYDPLAAKKLRLNMILEKFKLHVRPRDEILYDKLTGRMLKNNGATRDDVKLLLRLFDRGIGFHHSGLRSVDRGAVEILFRSEISQEVENQLKLYTLFSVQVLRFLNLLDEKGELNGLASVVCSLAANEPGNLIFAHLLQNGVFHRMCEDQAVSREQIKIQLLIIFAHLFTNVRLPLYWNPSDKKSYPSNTESKIFLEPVSDDCKLHIEKYNKKVENLYRGFMQMACPNNNFQGEVFSFMGHSDSSVSLFSSNIVHPIHDCLLFDEAFIPARALRPVDHRGREIFLNAYAIDFWHLQSWEPLEKNNGISQNKVWFLIHDFTETLIKIKKALLIVGRSKDPFVSIMEELANEYDKKFHVAFAMKKTD